MLRVRPSQVTRSRIMAKYAAQHPQYQFDLNFGHLSPGHRDALLVHPLPPA